MGGGLNVSQEQEGRRRTCQMEGYAGEPGKACGSVLIQGDSWPFKRSRVSTKPENCRAKFFFRKSLRKELCVDPICRLSGRPSQPVSPELGSQHYLRNMRWLATDSKDSML